MNEKNIQSQVMLALSRAGCTIFRNNIGRAVSGEFIRHPDGTFIIRNGRIIDFGVGSKGGSDLIGWTADGRFLAVEIKTTTGRISPEQVNFIERVRKAGGVAGVARSADDIDALLNPLSGI